MDLSRFKVVYRDKVLNAIALGNMKMPYDNYYDRDKQETIITPKFIEVLVVNEDGQIISIWDEAGAFQFLPIIGK